MKIAVRFATALALVLAAGLAASVPSSSAAAVSNNVVVVSNTADVVNGNVSSVSTLNEKPGRDGISLREALEAADHTRGTATVYIMFSHRLNGRTIELRSGLPPILRSDLVLEGVAPNGSPASVTLDGPHVGWSKTPGLLVVETSEVTVRWLRFTGVNPTVPGVAAAMLVGPGWEIFPGASRGPRTIAHLQVDDDVFDNSGYTFSSDATAVPNGLIVGSGPSLNGKSTNIGDVTIAGNTFVHYTGEGDTLAVSKPPGSSYSDVTIEDNTFDDNMLNIEGGATRIIGNTITSTISHAIGFSADTAEPNTVIDGTVLEDNTISVVNGIPINLGNGSAGGGGVISNTQLVNNILRSGSESAIFVEGGMFTSPSPNIVSGLTIENDTLVNDGGGTLLSLLPNPQGISGNKITNVIVRNTIMYDPTGAPIDHGNLDQPPDELTNSLIWGPTWAGGNTTSDPHFVNEPAGDYHLAAGSPAINAGTTIGAPSDDLDGAPRDAQPDIGAYEFGAVPRPLLTVIAEQLGGSGTVTSSPAGITCGTSCAARFDPNATVTLTAKPDRGSRFLGWQNGCSGKARCTVNLSSAQSVAGRFGP